MKQLIIAFVLLLAVQVQAQEVKKLKSKTLTIEVKGNCEMCKARIEKAALKTKGVKYALWNVDTKKMKLIYNEYKTSKVKICNSILAVGHDVDSLKVSDEVYQQLHSCCQYR